MKIPNLEKKTLAELRELAKTLGVKSVSKWRKSELLERIEEKTAENARENEEREEKAEQKKERTPKEENLTASGYLEVLQDGYGFLRADGYHAGEDDVFVPQQQVRRFHLKTGDFVEGIIPKNHDKDKNPPLIFVKSVNGLTPENLYKRPDFENLTPIYPNRRIELLDEERTVSNRLINLIAPLGRGQRGLIVSPPKAGKTTILKAIAQAIEENEPDMKIIVLLIDERPEEVTDMIRSVNKRERHPADRTEVIASTFDEPAENHVKVSEIVLERAKRMVETGRDVIILLDSLTRLSRAYNIVSPPSGKTLSGGLDPVALYGPKRFFGAARNLEEGGSLTILATCLVDTGSRMDDMIYEEFKGTGNMELHLDRRLAELRIFPAIDIYRSGTRKDFLLLSEEEMDAMLKLRRGSRDAGTEKPYQELLQLMQNTTTNEEVVAVLQKTFSN